VRKSLALVVGSRVKVVGAGRLMFLVQELANLSDH